MTNPTPRDSAQLPSLDFEAAWRRMPRELMEGHSSNAQWKWIWDEALRAQASSVEPYGQVTANKHTGQYFFYRWPQPPYLDNSSECITVYAGAPPAHIPADVEAYMVHGDYERCAFRHLDSAQAYLRGLLKSHPDGGYVIKPLVYAPQPQAVAASSPAQAVDAVADITKAAKRAVEALESLVHNKPYEGRYSDAILHLRAALQASRPPVTQQAVAEGAGDALSLATEALEEIALAGMSGTGQESDEAMTEWHARQAWKFIGIAARAKSAIAARAGQVAAPAMVPLSEDEAEALAREDVGGDLDWSDVGNRFATAPQRAAFRRGIRAAEKRHGIGLTVGGSNGGGAE